MDNLPTWNILKGINNIYITSPFGKEIQLHMNKVYFLTGKNLELEITQITKEMTENNAKPYFPKQLIGFYKFNSNSLDVSKFKELFKRAKLEGIELFVYKYNQKFLEDTDVVFSFLHPHLINEFHNQLGYNAYINIGAIDSIQPEEIEKNLLHKLLTSDYMVHINYDGVKLLDTISIGLMINDASSKDEDDESGFSITIYKNYLSIYSKNNQQLHPILDSLNINYKQIDENTRGYDTTTNENNSEFISSFLDVLDQISQTLTNLKWDLIFEKTIELC